MASQADDLAALRWAAERIDRLLPLAETGMQVGETSALRSALGWAAMACLHLRAMHRLVQAMVAADTPDPREAVLLGWMLSLLARATPGAGLDALMARAAEQSPGNPIVQMERAKRALLAGVPVQQVLPWLEAIDPAADGYPIAMTWLANMAFRLGHADAARRYYLRAQAVAPLGAEDALRLAHLDARGGPAAPPAGPAGADAPDATPPDATAPDAATPGPLDALAGHPLLPALHRLSALLQVPPTFDAPLSATEWAQALEASALALPEAAAALPWAFDDLLSLAQGLRLLAQTVYGEHARWALSYPLPLGPDCGSFDALRCLSAWQGLWLHVAQLAELAVTVERPLRGAPQRGNVRHWLDLLALGCDAWLMLGRADTALGLVMRAGQRLSPAIGGALLGSLRERCLLALGERAEAAAEREALAPGEPAEVLALRDWPDWLAVNGWRAEPLAGGGVLQGRFSLVTPDGVQVEHGHESPPLALHWVQAPGVQVRHSHALLSAAAGLLLPNPWYRGFGDFPYEHPEVLNRGRLAVSLRAPATVLEVAEPLLVLANMDALEHRNYYHWMVLTLTRAVLADEAGLLAGRRLLVPAEASGWMTESLALAGIGPERCRPYGRDEALHLADARLVSPALFASEALIEPTRARLWAAAGLDVHAPAPPTRLLYLSRSGENRRPLVEEEALAALAGEMGFEVVAPETLGLLDQVRLFAQARAVVGASGAALSNMMWMQPGTRALVLSKEEAAAPFWVALALLRGVEYRWLMGRNLPAYRFGHLTNSPYSIRLALARRALHWALGEEGEP